MPRLLNSFRCLRLFFLANLVATILVSCVNYNFSRPQPVDRGNIYSFPDDLTGKWKESPFETDIDFTVPVNNSGPFQISDHNTPAIPALNRLLPFHRESVNEDSGFYLITKQYVSLTISEREKIIKGAWPKLNNEKKLIYPPGNAGDYNVLKTVKYDSLNNPVDTTDNYIISGNKIYERNRDGGLEKGYDYYRNKDTLVAIRTDTLFVDLGRNAMLRKLNDSLYALNIKRIMIGENDPGWWLLILLEKTGKDTLVQWECSSKTRDLSCMFYARPSKYDYFYFDCNWTTAEIMRLKKEGYFTKSVVLIRIAE
ncbi:MAG: hypothetical protein HZB42_03370 [Sphingobacteriales bacterium]|nr:hypothetical protein [Sphingobacteriales bacterium]